MIFYESTRTDPVGGSYHQWKPDLAFGAHLHNSFEFLYVYEGSFDITVDGMESHIAAGQAILIFPNQIHSGFTSAHSKTYLCIFHNSLAGEYYHSIRNAAATNPVFDITDEALVRNIAEADGSRWQLKAGLYAMIAVFDRCCGPYLPRQSRVAERIGQLLMFISDHHTEAITMRDAAVRMGYDHHYLSNLLQKQLNTTFRSLLNEYRISHAKYLLTATDATVATVAQEAGYDSLCSFNRNFRALTGMTPTEYRQQHCKNSTM